MPGLAAVLLLVAALLAPEEAAGRQREATAGSPEVDVDRWVEEIARRRLQPFHVSELENTTLGKPGHVVTAAGSRYSPGATYVARGRRYSSRHMTHGRHSYRRIVNALRTQRISARGRPQGASLRAASAASEITKVPGGDLVDSEALLKASAFKIKPDDLIVLTKEVLKKGAGLEDPSCLAENFEFCAPVVGPLRKEAYLGALRSFDLLTAFPDMNQRYYNIHVDPFEHNRVWYFTRPTATHTGPLFGKPPTNTSLELPPQANSFVFDEEGKVNQMTIGYVMDRRIGNTGGLGGAFGFFYGTGNGFPIPECQPYKMSKRFRLFNWFGSLAQKLQRKA